MRASTFLQRSPLLLLAALLVALAVFAVGNGVPPAQAQVTPTVLVSNMGQTTGSSVITSSFSIAQAFTTGAASGGYTLGSIDIVVQATDITEAQRDTIRAELWSTVASGNDAGKPNAKLRDLTVPDHPISTGTVSFAAPANTTLAASTTYYAVIYTVGDFDMSLDITSSDSEDSGGAAGWTIANGYRDATVDAPTTTTTWSVERGPSLRITVNEAPSPLELSALTGVVTAAGGQVSALALYPPFDADTTVYTATVGYGVTELSLRATLADSGSSVKVGRAGSTLSPVTSGVPSDLTDLAVGKNEFTVEVTATDSTTQDYTVTVTRRPEVSFPTAGYKAGDLDAGFSGASAITTAIGSAEDHGHAVAVQADGKTVVVGTTNSGANWDFSVLRYTADGVLDPTFGTGGKVVTDINSSHDGAEAVAIQPDGKIVVAGEADDGSSNRDFAVARYNADGTLDTSFSSDGKVVTPIGASNDRVRAVGVQSDGKIVVAGYAFFAGRGEDFALARYNADGTLDTGFDTDGKVTTRFGGSNTATQQAWAMSVLPDDRVVVAGYGGGASDQDFIVARYDTDGSLDTSFSDDGWVITDVNGNDDAARAVAVQTDGKIVVAGEAGNGSNRDFAVVRYTADGGLDTDFDTDGKVFTAIGSGGDHGRGVGIGADGKIVVGGFSHNGTNQDFAVVRYTADGSLDASFDGDGKASRGIGSGGDLANAMALDDHGNVLLVGNSVVGGAPDVALAAYDANGQPEARLGGPGKVTTGIGSGAAEASSVAVQSDGKIVAAGYSNNGSNNDFALARYNADGSLDTSFSSDGKVSTAIGSYGDEAQAIAIQPDGKIVAAGYSNNGSNDDFALARYNVNGTLDTSFSSDGKVTTDIGSGEEDIAYAVAVQSDGKIVAAGYSGSAFALVRYTADGSLDTGFDTDGKVTTAIGTNDNTAYALAVQSDGKIVAAGYSGSEFALVRYTANGSLDTSFGTGGKVTTAIGSIIDTVRAVAIQSDGKIVVAGNSDNGSDDDFALARYTADGSLDTSFSSDGKLTTDFGSNDVDRAYAVAVQSDGKIVAAGYGNHDDFALARYTADGSLDTSFGAGGKVTTDLGSGDVEALAMALQPDGKIVAAGFSGDDFALARYHGFGRLVSNLGQTTGVTILTNLIAVSQGFRTGSDTEGYTLSHIQVSTTSDPTSAQRDTIRAELWSDSSGSPDAKLHDLAVPPHPITAGAVSFVAPANAMLAASTQYHLVVYTDQTGANVFDIRSTKSDAEDSGAAGWTIADLLRFQVTSNSLPDADETWAANTDGNALKLAVHGSVGQAQQTVADADPLDLSGLTGAVSADGTTFTAMTGAGAIVPAFDADTTGYRATVSNDVTHVRLTPTLADDDSLVKVGLEGSTLTPVTSGSASASIPLEVGDNAITVEVTASDSTTRDYTVTVRRVADGSVWWGTMTPKGDISGVSGYAGCHATNPAGADCDTNLTDDDFTLGSATYEFLQLYTGPDELIMLLSAAPTSALQQLKFCAGPVGYSITSTQQTRHTNNLPTWAEGVPVSLSIGTSCQAGTTPAVPGAVTGLGVTPGNTKLDLAWTAPSGTVTGYDVHYTSAPSTGSGAVGDDDAASGSNPATAWVAVSRTETDPPTASQSITSLDNGTTYRVRVRAVNAAGNGPWERGTGMPALPQAPGAPTGLGVTGNTGLLLLSWTAPATGGAVAGYDIHYTSASEDDVGNDAAASGADPAAAWVAAPRGTGATAGHVIVGLNEGTLYRVRVRAKNDGGVSAWLHGTGTPATQIPTVPRNLRVTAGDGRLDLGWLHPDGTTATGYDVHYTSAPSTGTGAVDNDAGASGSDPSAAWVDAGHTGTTTSQALTGLDNGAEYRVRVRGVNAAGNGPWARGTGTPMTADMLPAARPTATGGLALWTATLTVQAVTTVNGQVNIWGCGDGTGKPCTTNLTDNTFRFDGVEYRITNFTLSNGGYLSFKLNRNLAGEKRRLVLVVDGTRFSGRDGAFVAGGSVHLGWTGSGLTWSAGDTVSLSLVEIPTVRLVVSTPVAEGNQVSVEACLRRGLDVMQGDRNWRAHAPAGSVFIPLIVTPGTADPRWDYGEYSPHSDGTRRYNVHISPPFSCGLVGIPTHLDSDTGDETFTVMLDTNNLPSSLVAGNPASVEVTIQDAGESAVSTPVARLSATPNPLVEGGDVTVTVTLHIGEQTTFLQHDVYIPLRVTRESSEEGDHGTVSGVTIEKHQRSASVVIPTHRDGDGDDEFFTVAIDHRPTPPVQVSLRAGSVRVRIAEREPSRVSLEASPNPVHEGNTVTVTALLSQAMSSDLTVPVTVTGIDSERGDHGSLGSITVPRGQTTGTGTITTSVDDDRDDERFRVALGSVPLPATAGSPTSVEVTIADQTEEPEPGPPTDTYGLLSVSPSPAQEGDTVTLTATLENPAPSGGIVVRFLTFGQGGSPASADDYTLSPSTGQSSWVFQDRTPEIRIPAGQRTATATLSITADGTDEGDETLGVQLDVSFSDRQVAYILTLTIQDPVSPSSPQQPGETSGSSGDTGAAAQPTAVTLALDAAMVSESAGQATLTATLDAPAPEGGMGGFLFAGADGTASQGVDFTVPLAIFVPGGQRSATTAISITGDDLDEADETVALSALFDIGTALLEDTITLTITDDDTAGVTVSAASPLAVDEGGTATYTVVLDSQPTADVTISASSGDVGAAAVSPASHTFTPSGWNTPLTFTVRGLADDDTGDESVAISNSVASDDAKYAVLPVATVSVSVSDTTSQQQGQTNRAPTVSAAIADATIVNASGTRTVSLSGVFDDPDGDSLTVSAASSDEAKATVSVAADYATLTVNAQARGTATITVTANDGRGGTVDDSFTVTVKAAPYVASEIADVSGLDVGSTQDVSLSGVFSDADGDALTVTASSGDEAIATVSVAADHSALTVAGVAEGTATVTVIAQDSDGNLVTDDFNVSVVAPPPPAAPNEAPTVSSAIADATIVNETGTKEVSLSGVFSDADNDSLTITAASSDDAKATVSVAADYTSLTVNAQARGTATITVIANDGRGGTVSETFTVTVKAAPVVASAIADMDLKAGAAQNEGGAKDVALSGVFSDADGDALTFTAETSDSEVAEAFLFQGILTVAGLADGSATVTVTARDADGNVVSDTFAVKVVGPPTPVSNLSCVAQTGRVLFSWDAPEWSGAAVYAYDYDLTLPDGRREQARLFGYPAVSGKGEYQAGQKASISVKAVYELADESVVHSGAATLTCTVKE